MAYCTGYGAFRKTSTADAVARSFLLTRDFAVGKSSFFRRFDEAHFRFAKTGFINSCIVEKDGHNQFGCVRFCIASPKKISLSNPEDIAEYLPFSARRTAGSDFIYDGNYPYVIFF